MKIECVVGAGVWGCTVARCLAEQGRKVIVLEKRGVIGGNCRCGTDSETGIEIHSYGSHIFHTSLPDVWRFVNRFAEFNGYRHKVLARHNGKTYFLPLGLALINQFYERDLKPSEVADFVASEAGGGDSIPSNFEEQAIRFIGRPLYEAFIKNYTRKQWNRDPRELSADIIKRLPVRHSYDIGYFNDTWQGIPVAGYNRLFENLLNHPNIEVRLNTVFTVDQVPEFSRVYYSGPIDALFGYRFGTLKWRGLRFQVEKVNVSDWQGTSVVNYVDADVPYTRIHEFKHYHPERKDGMEVKKTIISCEYPADWQLGDEPYYPVKDVESMTLLGRYRELVREYGNLVVGGRLGAFEYYDMDKAIAAGLRTALTVK